MLLDCVVLIMQHQCPVEMSKGCIYSESDPVGGFTLDLTQGPSWAQLGPQPFLSVYWVRGPVHTLPWFALRPAGTSSVFDMQACSNSWLLSTEGGKPGGVRSSPVGAGEPKGS